MALSCGKKKQRGKKGGCDCGGCRHFHVHYHLPRQVSASAFIPHFLPRFFSLLSACVLVPPVLFLSVLAFLVLFVWFTLLYFLRSLWNKDSNSEFFERSSQDPGSDADKSLGEDVAEEGKEEKKALKILSELYTGDSAAAAEDCAKRFQIEEGHVDSDDSQSIPRIASSDDCLNCEVYTDDEKFIEEVIIFDIERGGPQAIANSDELSENDQVQDLPFDWFEEEIKSRDAIKSSDSSSTVLSDITSEFHDFSDKNGVESLIMDFVDEKNQNEAVLLDTSSHRGIRGNHCKCGEVFDDKEALTYHSPENSDFIDKHETREVILDDCGNDYTVVRLASRDDSADDGILYENKDSSEEKDPKNLTGLLDSIEVVFDQQQEIQKGVISNDNKLSEVLFLSEKQFVSSSGELSSFPNENGASEVPFVSVCQDKNGIVAYSSASSHYIIGVDDDKCEDHTDNNIEEASRIASTYCGSSDKHQNIQEVSDCLANGDNIDEVASLKNSIPEIAEYKDDKSNANCISEGASHGNRIPLVRRSPAPWWNFCGVIDVFAGRKD